MDSMDLFEAHYRMGFDQNRIGRCYISPKTWCILKEDGFVARGEDPRVFFSDGKPFVMDNTWGDASLLDQYKRYDRIRLPSTGKNLTIVPDEGRTLMVEWFKPLRVHETRDLAKDMWTPKIMRHENADLSYRGGTPGYSCAEKNHFYGFGHRTSMDEKVRHRPFLWILDTAKWKVVTSDLDNCDCFSNNIVDPTSVVEHGGKRYLDRFLLVGISQYIGDIIPSKPGVFLLYPDQKKSDILSVPNDQLLIRIEREVRHTSSLREGAKEFLDF
ncbi:hypothetical protein KFL_008380065 [Klebsormidium nitens]|uniref:Uncharacterized protein n=1 Tax=Klebsormidium nitens TaxID=105231 RepID=A0A1Y1ISH5_KLENI|nr:hypothetical protein KFL_008380065 [Klebsormidium nitens]|eukprot:GAQ91716.1 hypothetical protein KFL_008380065 [Klebsormidium nitens]